MALFTELDIYKAALELYTLCTLHVGHMDRRYRSTIGGDLRRDCREILHHVQVANSRTGEARIEHIESLRWAVGQVEVAARICADARIHTLSHDQHAAIIFLTQSIGKQATGWKQQTEKALANPDAKVSRSTRY